MAVMGIVSCLPQPLCSCWSSNCWRVSVSVQAGIGQREHQAAEETKERGQKHLVMQPGRTTVSPPSPREVAKELCKSETAALCVHL